MAVIPTPQIPTSSEQKEFIRPVTAKGQVTIPAVIREQLGVKAPSEVVFRVVGAQVTVEPVAMTLEEAFGSVQPITRPEDFKALREAALEEKAEKVISKMRR